MTSDGPRELAIDLVWDRGRLRLLVIHGDRPLHSDTLDPRSAIARARTIKKLKEKLPAIDVDELDQRLVEAAAKGPPSEPGSAPTSSVATFTGNPDPSAESVDGVALLDELASVLRRFVVLPRHAAEVLALWIVHTFVFDAFEFSPRLLINSPSMRCGKSRLLRLVAALVNRPLACEGITGPALFRAIEKYAPTMLIDEGDTMLRGKDTGEVLRGVLNAGHQRGGKVIRCVGDDAEPRTFDVYAPVAIAMIGNPPGTIEDRSIAIAMRRRMPGETVARFEAGRSLREQFAPLVRKCVRWAADNRLRLVQARPSMPPAIDDRAADCWYALFAIAEVAGGAWPHLAKMTALAVGSDREPSEGPGVELLRDLKMLFERSGVERMPTAQVIEALVRLDERPWPEYRHGQPITPRQLATLLAAFDIKSKNLRMPEGTVPKGYLRSDFEDAWARYFPVNDGGTPVGAATALRAFGDNGLGPKRSATEPEAVADENGHNTLENKACSAVALGTGGRPEPIADSALSKRLHDLVEEMAAEIDDAPPGTVAFTGEALRAYFQNAASVRGVEAALADAQARYQRQVEGVFLPLPRNEQRDGSDHG